MYEQIKVNEGINDEEKDICECIELHCKETGLVAAIDPKNNLYTCEKCDYSTCRKSSFSSHLVTNKHIKNNNLQPGYEYMVRVKHFRKPVKRDFKSIVCPNCEKNYDSRNGLWKHKKQCKTGAAPAPMESNNNEQLTTAIMELIKQNQDFQKQLLEIAKEGKNIINNTTNNVNNTTFNLQVFLNETCKDALNMVDFVKMMRIELTDLEHTAKLGYTDGVSRIFVNGLKELDVHKRPIHCSDLKREILYIKEDDVWEKDNEEKSLMKQAIRRVEHKNIIQIPLWVKAHPEALKGDDKLNTQYLNIIYQSTGGDQVQTQCDQNINKIIRNIAREVVISKG